MKTAILTGASKGIGKQAAKKFLDGGFEVINLSRTNCDLANITNINLDFKNLKESDLLELVDICKKSSEVAIVHNAATLFKDDIYSTDEKRLEEVFRINLIAPQIINKSLLPSIKKGSIIYIGSTLSEIAVPGAYTYIISKHALAGMMKATAQDLAGKNIHTTLICPGFTDTEMLKAHLNNDQEVLDSIAKANAFERLVKPSEIAELIFMSSQNQVLNGSIIHGNLGQKQA